jgi:hypothetical protein
MPSSRVLALVSADHVDVHADSGVDVRIERVPFLSRCGVEGERLALEYLDVTLPDRWRDLLLGTAPRATEITRPLRVGEIELREYDLALVDALGALGRAGEEKKERKKIWT